jgi:hypothetical protein
MRITVVTLLILIGFVFMYLTIFIKPGLKAEAIQTHWQFTVKPDKEMPVFLCKAKTPYSIETDNRIRGIFINENYYDFDKMRLGNKLKFGVFFDKNTNIVVDIYLTGLVTKRGEIKITQDPQFNYPRLLYLSPNEYSYYSIEGKKGLRLDIPSQSESYYIGHFKGGRFIREHSISNNRYYFLRFWWKHTVKFRAAEKPFLFVLANDPYFENLKIRRKPEKNPFYLENKMIENIYLLKKGEIVETPFWVEKGDRFSIMDRNLSSRQNPDKNYSDLVMIKIGNSGWQRLTNSLAFGQGWSVWAETDGYILLKGLRGCAITEVKIIRKKSWELRLKQNQSKRIKVYTGDTIESYSRSTYYADGKLMAPNKAYIHNSSSDGYIEFKTSVHPKPILVRVLERRGY